MVKLLVILAIIALLVVGFIVIWPENVEQPAGNSNTNQTSSNVNTADETSNTNTATPPAASGDVDDVTSALLIEASEEQSLSNDEDTDSALINSDSQAASEFGEATNTNDL